MDIDACLFQANEVYSTQLLSIKQWEEYQAHIDVMEMIELNTKRDVYRDKQLKNEPSRKIEIESRLMLNEQYVKARHFSRQAYSQYKTTQARIEFHRMSFYLNLRQLGPSERGVFIPESKLLQTANQF